MSDTRFALVWCPCESLEEARRMAHALVGERLVACVNVIGPMLSVFSWNGKTEEAEEFGLLCKTSHDKMTQTIARLEQLHKYNTAVIVGWAAEESVPQALAWLQQALGTGTNR